MSSTEPIPPTGGSSAADAFLRLLWPEGLPNGALLTVASRGVKGWTAVQFSDLAAAAVDLTRAPDRHLVMSALDRVERGRGEATDARAIPGLWADVDTLGGKHAAANLPTMPEALEWLDGLSHPPSVVLASGGGLYAFWLFETPWTFATDDDRNRAARVSKAWQSRLRGDAEARGWHLDGTSSLAQCLRAAGSLNGKYEPPREVRTVEPADRAAVRRYARSEFESFASSSSTSRKSGSNARTPAGGAVRSSSWLRIAAEGLGGALSTYDDARGGGIVLRTCPFCRGLESAGTIAEGTAHIASQSGDLRCKRGSCEASEGNGGATFGVWIERVDEARRPEVRLGRVKSDAADASWTDDGNATRFFAAHGTDLAFVPACGWRRWDGKRFASLSTTRAGMSDTVVQLVREVGRKLRRPASAQSGDEAKSFERHRRESLSGRGIGSTIQLARGAFESAPCTFDVDPLLLNVGNGTLDLRTRVLRPHRRADRLSMLAGTNYVPDARCADLDAFLEALTGNDAEFLDFVRRCVGYLLGSNVEDRIFLALGPGGTGKSTFVEALGAMLGDYAGVISFAALVARAEPSATRPELVAVRGKRLVYASEAPDGLRLDAATLKAMSGGDSMTVRGLYSNPTTFRPTWTTMLVANHAPRLDAKDPGNRRRLVVLPFEHRAERLDVGLRERLRRPDALEALLAFAVRGYAEWRELGSLGTCAAVESATAHYWTRTGSATAMRFVETCCEHAPDEWTSSADIRAAARDLAREGSSVAPSDRELTEALESRGFIGKRRNAGAGWHLRLRDLGGCSA